MYDDDVKICCCISVVKVEIAYWPISIFAYFDEVDILYIYYYYILHILVMKPQ